MERPSESRGRWSSGSAEPAESSSRTSLSDAQYAAMVGKRSRRALAVPAGDLPHPNVRRRPRRRRRRQARRSPPAAPGRAISSNAHGVGTTYEDGRRRRRSRLRTRVVNDLDALPRTCRGQRDRILAPVPTRHGSCAFLAGLAAARNPTTRPGDVWRGLRSFARARVTRSAGEGRDRTMIKSLAAPRPRWTTSQRSRDDLVRRGRASTVDQRVAAVADRRLQAGRVGAGDRRAPTSGPVSDQASVSTDLRTQRVRPGRRTLISTSSPSSRRAGRPPSGFPAG